MSVSTKELLSNVEHREYPVSSKRWRFYQEWNNAVFLHWKVDVEKLKTFVPDEIEIDLFEGQAWVSIVIFDMEKMRPRFLPSVKWISNFPEINIRTYVKKEGKSGVHFLSIEANKKLSCYLAKTVSGLPYRYSTIKRENNKSESIRNRNGDYFEMTYQKEDALVEKTPLDLWLTEKYWLCQDDGKQLNEFDIHHAEWSLENLELKTLNMNYTKFNSLIQGPPDKAQYSEGVQVLAWGKETTKR